MSYEEKKLQSFKDSILKEVEEKTKKIKLETLEKKEETLKEAKEKIEKEVSLQLNEKIKNLKAKFEFDLTKKNFEIKKNILNFRNKLTEKIFERCTQNIENFSKTTEYGEYLIKKIERSITKNSCTDKIIIKIRDEDLKFEKEISKLKNMMQIEVDKKIKLGGFKIIDREKAIEIDETFETALKEVYKDFYKTSKLNLKNF